MEILIQNQYDRTHGRQGRVVRVTRRDIGRSTIERKRYIYRTTKYSMQ
jgi:hypothetical protein